jgi:hypothetical protein
MESWESGGCFGDGDTKLFIPAYVTPDDNN